MTNDERKPLIYDLRLDHSTYSLLFSLVLEMIPSALFSLYGSLDNCSQFLLPRVRYSSRPFARGFRLGAHYYLEVDTVEDKDREAKRCGIQVPVTKIFFLYVIDYVMHQCTRRSKQIVNLTKTRARTEQQPIPEQAGTH